MEKLIYRSQPMPLINSDYWVTFLKATAAIWYLCYKQPWPRREPASGIKVIEGVTYVAEVEALSAEGKVIAGDAGASYVRFRIETSDRQGNERAMRIFEQMLLEQYQCVIDKDLSVHPIESSDIRVHQPTCQDMACLGCDPR